MILGTSSDRIGTPHGYSFYVTASKNLEKELNLPVAPYVGAAFGTFEDELRAIGGVQIRWSDIVSSMHTHDGKNIHHLLGATIAERHTLGLIWVDHEHVGLTYSVSFDF